MVRQVIAAILILIILGAVVWLGVSGMLYIGLVVAAGMLSLVLVRQRPTVSEEKGSDR